MFTYLNNMLQVTGITTLFTFDSANDVPGRSVTHNTLYALTIQFIDQLCIMHKLLNLK